MSQEGTTATGRATASLPVSPRVLDRWLRRARVGRGGTVLDIGSGADAVVQHLQALGYDAWGVCPSEEAADSEAPQDEETPRIQYGRLAASLPIQPHTADLVLVRDVALYRPVQADPESLTATANMLAALRPGREMMLIEPAQPGPDHSAHEPLVDAWSDHFSAFPGRLKMETIRIRPALFGLFGGGPSFEFRLAGFKVPGQARTRLEWHRLAHEAAMRALQSAGPRAA